MPMRNSPSKIGFNHICILAVDGRGVQRKHCPHTLNDYRLNSTVPREWMRIFKRLWLSICRKSRVYVQIERLLAEGRERQGDALARAKEEAEHERARADKLELENEELRRKVCGFVERYFRCDSSGKKRFALLGNARETGGRNIMYWCGYRR